MWENEVQVWQDRFFIKNEKIWIFEQFLAQNMFFLGLGGGELPSNSLYNCKQQKKITFSFKTGYFSGLEHFCVGK